MSSDDYQHTVGCAVSPALDGTARVPSNPSGPTVRRGLAPRALGYLRCSTSEQRDSGLGLDAQTAQIAQAADRLGLPLTDTFTDAGLSGGLPLEARPALIAALDQLRRGDTLIVAKRDRLGRSVLNVAMIERLVTRKDARIVSAAGEGSDDDGPTSMLMRQIIDAFSEYERAIIRSRTKAALQAKKAKGLIVGHLPYGYQRGPDGQTLVPQPDERAILRTMWQLRRAGATQRQIAQHLNAQGLRTRRATAWSNQLVSQLMTRHREAAA